MLVHLISLENEDPVDAYKKIRNELNKFDPELTKKKEIVVLTKTDVVTDPKVLEKVTKEMQSLTPIVVAITLYDDSQIKMLGDLLVKELS